MEPLTTIVATACQEDKWHVPFIQSMMAQTDQNFKALVFHNGPNLSMLSYMMEQCEDSDTIWYKQSDSNTGNWGTANRQRAIEECDTEYITQTSVQDVWLPQAVEIINKAIIQYKPDILLWNSINHVVGPCLVLDAQLAWSKVDWGNFAIRTDIAKKVGIQHGDKYTADWLFVNDVLNSGLVDRNKIVKTSAVLTIHN